MNYTTQAQEVLKLAAESAKLMQHPYIGTEHLLIGLSKIYSGVAGQVLDLDGKSHNREQVELLHSLKTGAMIAAACIRNIGEYSGAYVVYMGEINDIGGISLSLFLGMAMITLKLWQLADLAGPLVVLLAGQTVFILLYVVLVVFNVMGRDYDAAVLVSGTCGFGMGATPNAMANMQVVCEKYAPSIKAYLIIPLVGSLFADFLNSLAITLFINLI